MHIVLKCAVTCQSPPLLHPLIFIDLLCISFLLFLLLLLCLFPPIPTSAWGPPLSPSLHLCFCFSLLLRVLCPPPLLLLIWQAAILTQCAREWTEFIFCSCPPLNLTNTAGASCAHGGWMSGETGGEFSIHRNGGFARTLILPIFILPFSCSVKSISLSFFRTHSLPPIKPSRGACPCRWAGAARVPGSSEALSSYAEVWTMGSRWIGLATSNVSLTHGVNNARGKK